MHHHTHPYHLHQGTPRIVAKVSNVILFILQFELGSFISGETVLGSTWLSSFSSHRLEVLGTSFVSRLLHLGIPKPQ